MHYVILGVHSPEVCPTSNAATKALLLEVAPQIPKFAEENGVKIIAGPFVNREHTTVAIVEAARSEDLDAFLMQTRIPQWNQVRILPSKPLEEGMREIQDLSPLF
jgi:hypothetical protein